MSNETTNIVTTLSDAVKRSDGGQIRDAVAVLKEAGLPADMIAPLLQASGLEEGDVAGYTFNSPTVGGGNIVLNTICLGTCKSATVTIDVGCKNTIK